jgi:hypothetical protein
MQIAAGSHPRYRCASNKKRGASVCPNAFSVRESVETERIVDAIRAAIATPEAAAYIRKRIAERLGQLSRETDTELAERTARFARVEERIRGIIVMSSTATSRPLAKHSVATCTANRSSARRKMAPTSRTPAVAGRCAPERTSPPAFVQGALLGVQSQF